MHCRKMDGCGFGIAASTEEPESKFVKLVCGTRIPFSYMKADSGSPF